MRAVELMAALLRDRKGATAVEYGLIVSLIVIGMLVGLTQLGSATSLLWGNINTKVTAASAT
ncbi:MAG: Flp family type IVb pilin [Sphingomonas sp.]